jgi:hypothetical protein
VRDELYRRMRGARVEVAAGAVPVTMESAPATEQAEIVIALNAAVAELRALRDELGREIRP